MDQGFAAQGPRGLGDDQHAVGPGLAQRGEGLLGALEGFVAADGELFTGPPADAGDLVGLGFAAALFLRTFGVEDRRGFGVAVLLFHA